VSNEKKVAELLKRAETLEANKQNFLTVFQEVSDYFRPVKSNIIVKKEAGDKSIFNKIFDSYPIVAVETLASVLNGILTNKASRWFNIQTVDEVLAEDNDVSNWLSDATDILWAKLYSPQSGFEQALLEAYKDDVTFGTMATMIEPSKSFDLVFNTLSIKDYLIAENDEGRIDSLILKVQMTARQMLQKWGEDRGNLHETITRTAETRPDQLFDLQLHIYPRTERDSTKIDKQNALYAGCWVDVKNKSIIEETGFDTFPIAVGRSEKSTGELYGTSRAMMALPDARELNVISRQRNEAIELLLRPPLIVNQDFQNRIDLSPGALNRAKQNMGAGGRIALEAVNVVGNVPQTLELIQEKKQSIRETFFLDKLKIFDNPNATATQVLELRAEGFRIMSSLSLGIEEYLNSILTRSFDILFRKSFAVNDLSDGLSSYSLLPNPVFGELPDALKQAPDLKILFINPINQSQQATELNSIDVLLQTVANTAQLSPGVVDVINFDEVVRKKRAILSVDPDLINDKATVEEIRAARQQQIQQQQEMNNNQQQAATLKDLKQAGQA